MLSKFTKDTVIIADSPQTGFVNILQNPSSTSTYIKSVQNGNVVGRLTGNSKRIENGWIFVEVIYDERSLTNWIEDKGWVRDILVTDTKDKNVIPYYCTADNVRIRSTPDSTSDKNIVGVAKKGELVGYSNGKVVNKFMQLLGKTGSIYVYVSYLSSSKPSSTSSSTEVQPQAPTETQKTPIITQDQEGNKTLNVLGAKVPVDNSYLIWYAITIGVAVLGFRYLKSKLG